MGDAGSYCKLVSMLQAGRGIFAVKTTTSFLFRFLLVMGVFLHHAYGEESARAAFVHAMSSVVEGMKADEVEKLLGKPDDVRTQFDPGGISRYQTTEIWSYGTDGHLTFPTLGCVYMSEGRVQEVAGGYGAPPDAAVFSETDLRELLRLIDSTCVTGSYNPLRFIQAVNGLQPLGKEKALAAIGEYIRVLPQLHDRLPVFLLLRLLFEVPQDPGFMPGMKVGMPSVVEPADHTLLPLFPLFLVNGIPLNLVTGYALAGQAQPVEDHIAYFKKSGKWRTRPLVPSNEPLAVLDLVAHSPQWIYKEKQDDDPYGHAKNHLANELLQLIDTVYRIEPDSNGDRVPGVPFDQQRWNRIMKDVAALHIKWDTAKNIYVFANGTSLPEVKVPIYMRQIWDIASLGPAAKLIVERRNKDSVSMILQYNEYRGVSILKSTVKVYRAGVKEKPVAVYYIPPANGGDMSHQSTYPDVKLPAGEGAYAEITFGNETTKSAVFTP